MPHNDTTKVLSHLNHKNIVGPARGGHTASAVWYVVTETLYLPKFVSSASYIAYSNTSPTNFEGNANICSRSACWGHKPTVTLTTKRIFHANMVIQGNLSVQVTILIQI